MGIMGLSMIIIGSILVSKKLGEEPQEVVFVPTIALRQPTVAPTSILKQPTSSPTPVPIEGANDIIDISHNKIKDQLLKDDTIIYRYNEKVDFDLLDKNEYNDIIDYISVYQNREIMFKENEVEYFDLLVVGEAYVPYTIEDNELQDIIDFYCELATLKYKKEHPDIDFEQADIVRIQETPIVDEKIIEEGVLYYQCLYMLSNSNTEDAQKNHYFIIAVDIFYE